MKQARKKRESSPAPYAGVPYEVKRTNQEIEEQLNWANFCEERGTSAVRGMSYEQGVKNAIEWLTGGYDDAPIEEAPEGYGTDD